MSNGIGSPTAEDIFGQRTKAARDTLVAAIDVHCGRLAEISHRIEAALLKHSRSIHAMVTVGEKSVDSADTEILTAEREAGGAAREHVGDLASDLHADAETFTNALFREVEELLHAATMGKCARRFHDPETNDRNGHTFGPWDITQIWEGGEVIAQRNVVVGDHPDSNTKVTFEVLLDGKGYFVIGKQVMEMRPSPEVFPNIPESDPIYAQVNGIIDQMSWDTVPACG